MQYGSVEEHIEKCLAIKMIMMVMVMMIVVIIGNFVSHHLASRLAKEDNSNKRSIRKKKK